MNPNQSATDARLLNEENRIDSRVLNSTVVTPVPSTRQTSDSPEASTNNNNNKFHQFKETAMAIFNIVDSKLYKSRSNSLESYFRHRWQISRAQVYRFYNSARIIKELEDFPMVPVRERLCRSLKRLGKTSEARRLIWKTVVGTHVGDENSVTSTHIVQAWQHLVENGQLSAAIAGDPDVDEDMIDSSSLPSLSPLKTTLPSTYPPTVSSSSFSHRLRPIETSHLSSHLKPGYPTPIGGSGEVGRSMDSFLSQTTSVSTSAAFASPLSPHFKTIPSMPKDDPITREMQSVFDCIQNLEKRGYALQPFVNKTWVSQVENWRFIRQEIPPADSIALSAPHLNHSNHSNQDSAQIDSKDSDMPDCDPSNLAADTLSVGFLLN